MGTWELHFADSTRRQRVIPVADNAVARVGSDPGCEHALADPTLPPLAFVLHVRPDGVWIEPRAQLWLNGAELRETRAITPDDQLAVGHCWFVLRRAAQQPSAPLPSAHASGSPFGPPFDPTKSQAPSPPFGPSPHALPAQPSSPPFGALPPSSPPFGPAPANSPANAPANAFPMFGGLPPPVPTAPPRSFRTVAKANLTGLGALIASGLAAYLAPMAVAALLPELSRWFLIGAMVLGFVTVAILWMRYGDVENASLINGGFVLGLLLLLGFSFSLWEAYKPPQLTGYNPTDTPLEFVLDGGAQRATAAPGSFARFDISRREHTVEVRAGGRVIDTIRGDARGDELQFLATPLGLGCYVQQPRTYSTYYSSGGSRASLQLYRGQRWYATGSHYVIEQPPSSMTVRRGTSSTTVVWFRAVECESNEVANPMLIPLAPILQPQPAAQQVPGTPAPTATP